MMHNWRKIFNDNFLFNSNTKKFSWKIFFGFDASAIPSLLIEHFAEFKEFPLPLSIATLKKDAATQVADALRSNGYVTEANSFLRFYVKISHLVTNALNERSADRLSFEDLYDECSKSDEYKELEKEWPDLLKTFQEIKKRIYNKDASLHKLTWQFHDTPEEIVEDTKNAYSYDRYGYDAWLEMTRFFLYDWGLAPVEVEELLRSVFMRHGANTVGYPLSKRDITKVKDFFNENKDNVIDSVKRWVRESIADKEIYNKRIKRILENNLPHGGAFVPDITKTSWRFPMLDDTYTMSAIKTLEKVMRETPLNITPFIRGFRTLLGTTPWLSPDDIDNIRTKLSESGLNNLSEQLKFLESEATSFYNTAIEKLRDSDTQQVSFENIIDKERLDKFIKRFSDTQQKLQDIIKGTQNVDKNGKRTAA